MSCSCYRGQFSVCTFNTFIVSGLWDCVCELQPEYQGHTLHGGNHGLQRLRVARHPLLPPRPRGGLPGVVPTREDSGLNDLLRTNLSWARMIRLYARPLPPPLGKLSLFLSLPVCLFRSIYRGGGGGWGRGRAWSQFITTARKLGPL